MSAPEAGAADAAGGAPVAGFAGLAASGLTVVFDNMMDGTGCVTSKSAWKWDETVGDIGMRLCDLAHQDDVTVGRTLADLSEAKRSGRVAIVLGLEAATPIENELDRLDILYGLGVRQIGIAYDLDDTALQRDLGPIPKTPLVEGVKKTLAAFRALHREGRLDASDLE